MLPTPPPVPPAGRGARGWRSGANPFPPGTLAIGSGLLVNGVTSYAFLVLTARVLGPVEYAPLAVLWATMFLVGPGFFLPLEQEVSRAVASRRATGVGAGPVLRRAALLGGGLLAILATGVLVASPALLDRLLRGEWLLVTGLLLGLGGTFAGHLARGTYSGLGRFTRYALFLGGDATIRLVLAGGLALLGVRVVGPYGVILGAAPLIAVGVSLIGQRGLVEPGPPAGLREVTVALGSLTAGSLMAQLLLNAGPLAVELLGGSGSGDAGRFLAGLVIGRVPLFFFQAVQAALLPRLSSLAGGGRLTEFRSGLRRLLIVVGAIGVLAVAGGFSAGPWVVRTLFGADFALGHRTVGLLAAASAAYILAIALAQALIALAGHGRVAIAWSLGVVGFVATIAAVRGDDLFLRVELGFVVGAATAAAAMALFVVGRLRSSSVSQSWPAVQGSSRAASNH